jgi:hypothetical protein
MVLAVAIGVYPKPLFQILEQPVNQIVRVARPNYPGLEPAAVNAAVPAHAPEPQVASGGGK